MAGSNATVIAYGQMSSGGTHQMLQKGNNSPGVASLVLGHLLLFPKGAKAHIENVDSNGA